MKQRTSKSKPKRTVSSGEGERRTIIGIDAEYRVAAQLIYDALRKNELIRFWKGALNAGQIDDVVIESKLRVDAYQIKWSQNSGTISFRNITVQSDDSVSLITQLSHGWQAGKSKFGSKPYYVHLISPLPASSRDQLPIDESNMPQRSDFAFFLKTFREPAGAFRNEWKVAVEKLINASELTENELMEFMDHCHFDLEYRRPVNIAQSQQEQATINDIKSIADLLVQLKIEKREATLTRDQLISRLRWSSRFEFKSRHEYPTPNPYTPITGTQQELLQVIADSRSGYIALTGTPGSGKSTLLTRSLQDANYRVVRYYAYVPNSIQNIRGESDSFFHDILHTLTLQNAIRLKGILPIEREALIEVFNDALRDLHEDWKANGKKTLIVIDGIDHIEREQHPMRSLISDLPLPVSIPEGVLLILGSQPYQLELLQTEIKVALREPGRTIEMKLLTRAEIDNMLSRREDYSELAPQLKDLIFERCGGHPLGFQLVLNALNSASSDKLNILENFPDVTGEIETMYESQWKRIVMSSGLHHLTGLLSRINVILNFTCIRTWKDEHSFQEAVDSFQKDFYYLFTNESETRWYFFHNSFRLFLQRKTAEFRPGEYSKDRDKKWHSELATYCLRDSANPDGWDSVYHLLAAGEETRMLGSINADFFRDQFLNFRHPDGIIQDIKLCLLSALRNNHLERYVEYQLIGSEIESRMEYSESEEIVKALLALQNGEAATRYTRMGRHLNIEFSNALALIPAFVAAGLNQEAKVLIEIADPTNKLRERSFDENNRSAFEWWIKSIALLGDLKRALNIIEKAEEYLEESLYRGDSIEEVKTHLKMSLCRFLIEHGDLEFASSLYEELDGYNAFLIAVWLVRDALYTRSDNDAAKKWYDGAKSMLDAVDNDSRIELAELARELDLSMSELSSVLGQAKPIWPDRMRLAEVDLVRNYRSPRLYYFLNVYLGRDENVLETPTEPKSEYEAPAYALEQFVRVVAIYQGHTLRNEYGSGSLRELCLQAETLFDNAHRDNDHRWYIVRRVRVEIIDMLIMLIETQEDASIIGELLSREWSKPGADKWWSPEERAKILIRHSDSNLLTKEETASILLKSEHALANDEDYTYEKFQNYIAQCNLLIEGGKTEFAKRWLGSALESTFGVHYRKDYQTNDWMKWLVEINRVYPSDAGSRIEWFAKAILPLEYSTEGRAASLAGSELIGVCAKWNPAAAISLLGWFAKQKVIHYTSALEDLVHQFMLDISVPFERIHILIRDFIIPLCRGNERIATQYLKLLNKERNENRELRLEDMSKACKIFDGSVESDSWAAKFNEALISPTDRTLFPYLESQDSDSEIMREMREKSTLELIGMLVDPIEYRASNVLLERLKDMPNEDFAILSHADPENMELKAAIAAHLAREGNKQAAFQLAAQVFVQAGPHGWHEWYDGGSRLKAFRTMCTIDREAARKVCFDTVLKENEIDAGSLRETLPLIFPSYSIETVWPLIELHLSKLLHTAIGDKVDLQLSTVPMVGANVAILRLLCEHLEHPIAEFREQAFVTVRNLLLDGEVHDWEVLNEYLTEDKLQTESVLCCIASVLGQITIPSSTQAAISTRLDSSDLMIRYWASI